MQGITEFLPISSSGHLIILHDLLNFNVVSNLAFDVSLHTGTFIALLIFFRSDLHKYIAKDKTFLKLIIIASIPAGICGLIFNNYIEANLRSSWIVVIMLVLIGALFIFIEKKVITPKKLNEINLKNALIIGLAQIVALIPGTSRSGITIIAGMQQKINKRDAAAFSFLISLPIFTALTLKNFWDLSKISISPHDVLDMAIGMGCSALIGYFSIKYLLKFLEIYSLRWFAYYRFFLAFLLIIYIFTK